MNAGSSMSGTAARERKWQGANSAAPSDRMPRNVRSVVLLALLGLLGQTQLNAMNGMKNLVSALLTAIAVGIYAAGGIVQWRLALVMMVAATLGGYGGARVARRLPATVLRWGIVATGLVMAGLFFARQ